ncbi:hypothetical protein Daus18300_006171 [Diaporthe australafricana]|uniref:protein-ribulosamine 3-kinase n=1 Tax=Diaporthe australafricana TaxID=127596 RepID=A0ABR3WWT0_9PEZI
MLPKAIPSARIARFAYQSEWLGRDAIQQRLPLVSDQLLSSLLAHRKSCPKRPLLFIGHCFGGIVVQKAIIIARLHNSDYGGISDAISGVVLLGTPMRGSNSQSKAAMLASVASAMKFGEKSSLLRCIEKDSEMLKDILHDFTRLVNVQNIQLVCFFEQFKSDIAKPVRPKSMKWLSHKEIIVDEESGCVDGYPKYGLAADHFTMHRYNGPDDGDYCLVKNELSRLADAALIRKPTGAEPDLPDEKQEKAILSARDQACLNSIFITDAKEDMVSIETNTDRLMKDSNRWLFEHPSWVKWLSQKDQDVLWVHGDPGKGKTFISISAVRHLEQQKLLQDCAPRNLLLYFFCDNKDDRRNDALSIMRGLLHQLFSRRPDLCFLLRAEVEKRKEHLLASPTAIRTLWSIFNDATTREYIDNVYIIIDGLDESGSDSVVGLLSLITSYSSDDHSAYESASGNEESSSIKWMFTSRNETHIRELLNDTRDIDLEDNAAAIASSVSQYITSRVEYLRKTKRYPESLAEEVRDTLTQKAEGTFLWVALACRELSKPKVRSLNTRTVLTQLPSGLDHLYTRILDQILSANDDDLAEHARTILRSMALAFRPLDVQEIVVVARLELQGFEAEEAFQMMMEYMELCSSIVSMRNDTAHFVHKSAQTYVLTRQDIVYEDVDSNHADMAMACFEHISDDSAFLDDSSENASVSSAAETYGGLTWLVKVLVNERGVEQMALKDSLGNDALHWAAAQGWIDTLDYLLDNKADVTATNSAGLTALCLASEKGNLPVVKSLIQAGADVNFFDVLGSTLLHKVATNGHVDILRYLLESGADVDARDHLRWTPIQRACSSGDLPIVKILREKGANMTQIDREGMSLLHYAAAQGHTGVATYLIRNGVSVDATCYEQWTPLHEASWAGEDSTVSYLLRHGASIRPRTQEGHTALHQAAWNGHLSIVKRLLKAGADVHQLCHEGETALHQAAWQDHEDIAQILLDAGSKPSYENIWGKTPIDHAESNGSEATLARLRKHILTSQPGGPRLETLTLTSVPPEETLTFETVHKNHLDPTVALDPAIARAIPGAPVRVHAHHHGHAGFSVPLKIKVEYNDGSIRHIFCKGYGNAAMFSSEFFSLESMNDAMRLICPRPLFHGPMQDTDDFFLLTEFLETDPLVQRPGSGMSMASKLAIMHSQPVIMPKGYDKPMFGFPVQTFCGSTPQDNTFTASWADFFARRRVAKIASICEERHGADEELQMWITRTIETTIPALLRDDHLGGDEGIRPSIVHGDLWMGNRAKGQFEAWDGIEDICFDPSCTFAHNEYDFAIMRLFGGFMAGFWAQYHAVKPKTEPVAEYEDRISLYSVYHIMNHYALHAGGWKDDAIEVMETLWNKYQGPEGRD